LVRQRSRPHKVSDKTAIRPIEQFEVAVRAVMAAVPFRRTHSTTRASIRKADARKLPLNASSVDIAICSPPYLNAIDYLRGHKFSLVWMGYNVEDLRRVRATDIGTEVSAGAELHDPLIAHALRRMGNLITISHR
jgi:hypothetical protein